MREAGILKPKPTAGGHWRYHRSVLVKVFGIEFEDDILGLGEKRTMNASAAR